ncbi:MAG: nitrile hydratase accessory protein [Gammaproteobacteria bacterium]|nr:nitrile hydratase accessory protein [Gammaproteobacteria bacterium]MDH3856958.1 nitrile hydratase accessory protein [Gammaproteobacteria bacterium]
MGDSKSTLLKPLASVDGQPAFDEPWQAEALAIADTLVQYGMFSASAWSDALGAALTQAQSGAATDDQSTYYQCVLIALERLVAEHSEIDQQAMSGKREDWEQAYLSTPHGQPVKLKTDPRA